VKEELNKDMESLKKKKEKSTEVLEEKKFLK
jgi:hypothetical protein